MLCGRTLENLITYLACSLNDNEGSELKRIARKNCDYDPDGDGIPDGPDFEYEECEDELNHIRWSETFLTSTLNDALRILHMERPDLFTERTTMTLAPGCVIQQVPDGCKFAGKIRNASSCDDTSKPVEVSANQLRTSEALNNIFCKGQSANNYVVKGSSFDPNAPHEFIVNPAPPFGVESKVSFNCVMNPPCYNWDDDADEEIALNVFDDYEPFFVEYILFRAHMTDRESESSLSVADRHWNSAFKYISDGKQADYTFYHPDLYLIGPIAEGTGERIVLQSE